MLKTQEKRAVGGNWVFFLLDALKTTFWMENLTQKCHSKGFPPENQGTYFNFWKREGEASAKSPPKLINTVKFFILDVCEGSTYAFECPTIDFIKRARIFVILGALRRELHCNEFVLKTIIWHGHTVNFRWF